jgi:hypothetical protein
MAVILTKYIVTERKVLFIIVRSPLASLQIFAFKIRGIGRNVRVLSEIRDASPAGLARRGNNAIMNDATQTLSGGSNYMSDILAIQMRNMEALWQAQQEIMKGSGDLAKHQMEMLESTLRRTFGARSAPAGSASDIRGAIGSQIDSLKTSILENQLNSNVLSELAARSGGEAANKLQSRMMAALDEFKAALEKALPDGSMLPVAAAPAAAKVPPASTP